MINTPAAKKMYVRKTGRKGQFLPQGLLLKYLTFCLVLFLFVCTGLAEAQGTESGTQQKAPVDGGNLVLGSIGEPSNLNPYISSDSASHEVADLIFIAPLRYNKNLELELWAAESFDMSEVAFLTGFITHRPQFTGNHQRAECRHGIHLTFHLSGHPVTF